MPSTRQLLIFFLSLRTYLVSAFHLDVASACLTPSLSVSFKVHSCYSVINTSFLSEAE